MSLYNTTNGGDTWQTFTLDSGNVDINDLQFFNPDTGYFTAVGHSYPQKVYIGKSFNGGET